MFCPLLTSSSSAGHSWSWFWWCNLNCSPSDVCWKGTDWYELFLGQILVLSHRAGRGSETHLQLGTAFFFLRYIHFARSLFQHNVGFIFLFSSKYSNKISYREHTHESTQVNMSHDKCQLGLIEKVHEFVQTEAEWVACHRSDVSIREVKTVQLRILSGINKADIHMKDEQWNSGRVEECLDGFRLWPQRVEKSCR